MTTPPSSFITSDALTPAQELTVAVYQVQTAGLEYGKSFGHTFIEHFPNGFDDPQAGVNFKDAVFDRVEAIYRDGLETEGLETEPFCTVWRDAAEISFSAVIREHSAKLTAQVSEVA